MDAARRTVVFEILGDSSCYTYSIRAFSWHDALDIDSRIEARLWFACDYWFSKVVKIMTDTHRTGRHEGAHVSSGTTKMPAGMNPSATGARSHARNAGVQQGGMRPVSPSASHSSHRPATAAGGPGSGSGPASFGMVDSDGGRKGGSKKKVAFIVAGIILALLLAAYVAGVAVFSGRFYPSTSMGKLDLSMKSLDEAAALVAEAEADYALNVSGQGVDFTISAEQSGVSVDAQEIVQAAADDIQPFMWPVRIWGEHDEAGHLVATGSMDAMDEAVRAEVKAFNEGATPSQDATVAYDADANAYVVQKEVYGTQVSEDAVVEAAKKAAASLEETLELGDDVVIKPAMLSDDARLTNAAEAASAMVKCDATLMAQGSGETIAAVNGEVVSSWISFDESWNPVLDEGAMGAWIEEFATSLNTVGTTRTYTRGDGKVVTAEGGRYGWQIDSATVVSTVEDIISSGATGEVEIPCSQTGNGYTKPGMDWGAYCDVDLTEQHAYYYDASGNLLWESGIVSGLPQDGNDTPTGVWYLENLATDVSLKGPIDPETNKPKWDSPVDYWMPFKDNMWGLHDAPWQSSSVFSDPSAYKWAGSHGCVNLPVGKAGELFNIIQIGDPVIVHW